MDNSAVAIENPAAASWVPVAALTAWDQNPKPHDAANLKEIARSIRRFDFGAPIVAWKSQQRVVAGHGRLEAARLLLAEDPGRLLATDAPGPGLVPVRWVEFASEQEAAAYALVDNRLTEANPMDEGQVAAILASFEGPVELPGYDEEALSALLALNEPEAEQEPFYTDKIKLPLYEPKGAKPAITELYDNEKTRLLLEEIAASEAPDEIKGFLRLAAQRHTSFHFRNIAEYYCHASPEVQALFEKSALVLIDFDKALENGFIKVTDRLAELAGLDEEDRDAE